MPPSLMNRWYKDNYRILGRKERRDEEEGRRVRKSEEAGREEK
jgi:hypothetical protein